MANTFITMKNIARMALPILKENLVIPNLIYTDASKDFVGKGDTVQIRKPPTFTANTFTSSVSAQDNDQVAVDVVMDKLYDVTVAITAKDLALKEEDFFQNVAEPMAIALAEKINTVGLELAADIPYYSGTPGTAPSSLADFTNIMLGLDTRNVPLIGRQVVWDAYANAKLLQLDSLVEVDKSGSPLALRSASMGRVMNMDNYMSQAVYTHTAGTFTAVATPLAAGAASEDDATIDMDGGAGTETLVKGDLMTIGDYQYVVTAAAAASSGAITAAIYPALKADVADNVAITFPDKTALGSTRNVGFNKNAFAFVTRALALPADATPKSAYATTYNGVTLRVVRWYDGSAKTEYMSMDVLCGYKTLYKELAHIALG